MSLVISSNGTTARLPWVLRSVDGALNAYHGKIGALFDVDDLSAVAIIRAPNFLDF